MKTIIKLTLVLSLFGSVAFADGDMPGGNLSCPPAGCPPPCTENCMLASRPDDDGTLSVSDTAIEGVVSAIDFAGDMLGIG